MDIRQIADSERDLWNQFVAGFPTGDLLQSFEWGEVKASSGGWIPIRMMAFENDQPCAAVSLLKRRIPRLKMSILYAPRGPVADITNPDLTRALAASLRDVAKAHSAVLLKIDPPVLLEDRQSITNLRELGFLAVRNEGFGGTQPKCVMQLDLDKDSDALMAEFKPKTRYNIRLAEKKGVTVRQADSKDDLRRFYDILIETAKRDSFLVRGYHYFETMWDVLSPPEYARLFLAEYNSEPIAGALCFYFGDRCWYTYGASSNSYRNLMPNHLMQWRMIEHAKSLGCKLYDFRGVSPRRKADSEDHLQGLNKFKAGFGARYVEYIGDYDLPFSLPMYWLWSTAAPKISAFIKGRKRTQAAQSDI